MDTPTDRSFIIRDSNWIFLSRLPRGPTYRKGLYPWRLELDNFPSRLPCGHSYRQELHHWRLELEMFPSRLPCGHPYRKELHLWRLEMEIFPSRLPCGHPYRKERHHWRLELEFVQVGYPVDIPTDLCINALQVHQSCNAKYAANRAERYYLISHTVWRNADTDPALPLPPRPPMCPPPPPAQPLPPILPPSLRQGVYSLPAVAISSDIHPVRPILGISDTDPISFRSISYEYSVSARIAGRG